MIENKSLYIYTKNEWLLKETKNYQFLLGSTKRA